MDIVHGGQKTESAHKFKQVEVDVKCMQTNFGGHDHYGFGDFAFFFCLQNGQISLSDHGL